MGKTVQFDDFNASDILGADVWQNAHFSLGSSVQNGDSGGLVFTEAKYTDGLDSVDTSFWADRNHDGVYETQVNTTNSLAVPGETILVRHKMDRENSNGDIFFESALVRQLKDNTNGTALTPTEVVSYPEGDMPTAYDAVNAANAFNTDDITRRMSVAVFPGQSTIMEYKITAPSGYNHTVVESCLFGQPPFTSIYTGADGFRTQKELKWDTPAFTNLAEDVTVTYDADGGIFADNTTENKEFSVLKGSSHEVLAAPTKEGCAFAGWKKDTSTTIYKPEDTFEVETDVVLTAQWKTSASLTITKTASGDYADLTRDYTFSIDLPDGKASYTCNKYAAGPSTPTTVSLSNSDATFTLKTGERIVIEEVPLNQSISVEETGLGTGSETGEDGHYKIMPEFTVGTEDTDYKDLNINGATATFKLMNDAELSYTNYLNGVVPSGLSLNNWTGRMVFLLVAMILAANVAFVVRRRRHRT